MQYLGAAHILFRSDSSSREIPAILYNLVYFFSSYGPFAFLFIIALCIFNFVIKMSQKYNS